jgi:hypothetical protein
VSTNPNVMSAKDPDRIRPLNGDPERSHLFVNYATEDSVFADWLALKLATEGFRVWYDRIKLLGGESYPIEIDDALRNRVFRVLSVISRASLDKPNPLKERTLALSISRERGVDFLIPLRIDSLQPSELGFQLVDLTHISFDESWHAGLVKLLKKLESVHAPRDFSDGRMRVASWLSSRVAVKRSPERLWSNLLPIRTIPGRFTLFRVETPGAISSINDRWPILKKDDHRFWAFTSPDESLGCRTFETKTRVDWAAHPQTLGESTSSILSALTRRAIELDSTAKGMEWDSEERAHFFPKGLVADDTLRYTKPDGSPGRVRVVGFRSRRLADGAREITTYHLGYSVHPIIRRFGEPVCRISVLAKFYDGAGQPLPPTRSSRKRKALARSWWNLEWLNRVLGFAHWIASGNEEHTLLTTESGRLAISCRPLEFESPISVVEGDASTVDEPVPGGPSPNDDTSPEASDELDDDSELEE